MVASTFRVLAVVIFAVHILFVISGEAISSSCTEVLSWKMEAADEWLDKVKESQFKRCFKPNCVPANRDFLYKKGEARAERWRYFSDKCKRCIWNLFIAEKKEEEPIASCIAAQTGPGKFSPPHSFDPPKLVAPPKQIPQEPVERVKVPATWDTTTTNAAGEDVAH